MLFVTLYLLLATPYFLYAGGYVYWAPDGVLLSNRYAYTSDIVSDGKGGAIVILNAGSSIGAQRLEGNGNLLLWNTNGMAICTVPGLQENTCITTDMAGGTIIAWSDVRNPPG